MRRVLAFLYYPGDIRLQSERDRPDTQKEVAGESLARSAHSRLSCWCSACEPGTSAIVAMFAYKEVADIQTTDCYRHLFHALPST
jgi:hypothetical protein